MISKKEERNKPLTFDPNDPQRDRRPGFEHFVFGALKKLFNPKSVRRMAGPIILLNLMNGLADKELFGSL